jgi:uncharacterized protein (TIGR00369 family)
MYKPKILDYKENVLEIFSKNKYSNFLGFRFNKIVPGQTEGIIDIRPEFLQQNNFTHGGIILTLCDITDGFAAYTLVDKNTHIVTAEIKVSCLRPAVGKHLFSRGRVIKPGKRIFFCESEVWANTGKKEVLVAKSSSSMAVINEENYGA